jgi:phage shock protein PspC (stress-responsive transcriptional regulator)
MPDGAGARRGGTLSWIIDKETAVTDTTATTSPTAPADSERKLVRPTEGRVLAGVAAGLARYFGISPVVYRVAFAALVLLGGSGLILYAAAWLVIPDERRGESVVEEAVHNHRERPWLVIGVGLVGLGLILGIAGGQLWANPSRAWLPALAVGLAILWWQRRDRLRGDAPAAGATSPTGAPAVLSRRRWPVFPAVLGTVVAGAGVLGLLQATDTVDVNWTVALAGGVVLVGVGIAVGAFFGGVGALAALGAILASILVAVAAIDVPLRGPVGHRTVHPASILKLHDTYRQAIGDLEVDLQDVQLPAGETDVNASVGIGHLTVRVPQDVRVEVTSHVTGGESRIFGSDDNGWNVERTTVDDLGQGNGRSLVLNAKVGFGEIDVVRG